jgi:uncharacterized protein YmfQ (DUF2313 family)
MATSDDYTHQALQLLPRGDAWTRAREAGSTIGKLFAGVALTFSRIGDRVQQLMTEARPRMAVEALPEWEAEFGLPDSCNVIASTTDARQAAVWQKQTAVGGQSIPYFTAQAAKLGYTISIDEFQAFTTASTVDQPLYDDSWAFYWRVNVLADAGTGLNLQCVITRDKPAHTTVFFA